jgi:hypothetical protein
MNKRIGAGLAFALGFTLAAGYVVAQSLVDQGKPGRQGPWPVTITSPTYPSDGGYPAGTTGTATYPYPCSQAVQTDYVTDGAAQTMGSAPSRLYTIISNSLDNTSGNARCRADSDGGIPVVTAGTVGDVLSTGDCISYTNPPGVPIRCSGGGIYLTTFECVP